MCLVLPPLEFSNSKWRASQNRTARKKFQPSTSRPARAPFECLSVRLLCCEEEEEQGGVCGLFFLP